MNTPDEEPQHISRPCGVCGVTIKVVSLNHRYCGEPCAVLAQRRQDAEDANLPHSHPERHAVTSEQKAMQKRAINKQNRRGSP